MVAKPIDICSMQAHASPCLDGLGWACIGNACGIHYAEASVHDVPALPAAVSDYRMASDNTHNFGNNFLSVSSYDIHK